MNHVITPPARRQATVACPVCCGSRSHPDQPPGQVWDAIWDRPVDCYECDGTGYLTTDELVSFVRETQDAELAALVLERDPALTLEEMLGCDNIDALYGDLGGEA